VLVMGVTMAAVVKCRGGVGVAFGTALGFAPRSRKFCLLQPLACE